MQNRVLKTCNKCGIEKRPDQFDLTFNDVRKSVCLKCRAERARYLRENKFDPGPYLQRWRDE